MGNKMSTEKELSRLRDAIDQVDSDLVKLISERAKLASDVAEVKRADTKEEDVVFNNPYQLLTAWKGKGYG